MAVASSSSSSLFLPFKASQKSLEELYQLHSNVSSPFGFAQSIQALPVRPSIPIVHSLVVGARWDRGKKYLENGKHSDGFGEEEFVGPSENRNMQEMAVPEVNKRLLGELQELGFPLAPATRALHYTDNSSIAAAVDWLFDHLNDPDIDQMPLVPVNIEIESSDPSSIEEEVKLKAQELRDRVRIKKENEEKKLERESEKERRRSGKELLKAKSDLEENERKRYIALRKAEKEQEKKDRDRIREKLQQDKAERRRRLGLPVEDPPQSIKSASNLMQEEKVSVPVKFTVPATVTTTEVMMNCLRSLKRNHKDDGTNVRRAFETLLIYIRNVAKNPDEEKFRKIRISNPAFQARVGKFKEGTEFLELCGFERVEGGKFLYLPRDNVDMEVLKSAGTALNSAITNPFFGLLSK